MKAPIVYVPDFISDKDAAFHRLRTELEWEKRDAPRHEYYCNDVPKPYIYGRGRGAREYLPRPWHPVLLDIRAKLEVYASAKFEVCFLNLYLSQRDQLGWHADNSPEMDDARPIGVVSFGVEREIWFRPNEDANSVERMTLNNGSLCLMNAGMQDVWQHRIPKASFVCGERISLTFRGYIP